MSSVSYSPLEFHRFVKKHSASCRTVVARHSHFPILQKADILLSNVSLYEWVESGGKAHLHALPPPFISQPLSSLTSQFHKEAEKESDFDELKKEAFVAGEKETYFWFGGLRLQMRKEVSSYSHPPTLQRTHTHTHCGLSFSLVF